MCTLVMGILNVTPDSFSDGGLHAETAAAVRAAQMMAAAGAAIIDIGAESTRPGATPVSPAQEWERLAGPLAAIASWRDANVPALRLSVDTRHAGTARHAVAAGADLINDVSGGLTDPQMADTIAQLEVDYICQHWRGTPQTMHELAVYEDVVGQVRAELEARVAALLAAGVKAEKIVIDPGLGFAKEAEHNWEILRHLEEFTALGYRVLIGASRKRFLQPFALSRSSAERKSDGAVRGEERDLATAVVSALAARAGVWGVRVHDVPSSVVALAAAHMWEAS